MLSSSLMAPSMGVSQNAAISAMALDTNATLAAISAYHGAATVVADLQTAVSEEKAAVIYARLAKFLASLEKDFEVLQREIQDLKTLDTTSNSSTGAAKSATNTLAASFARRPRGANAEALMVREAGQITASHDASHTGPSIMDQVRAARNLEARTPLRRNEGAAGGLSSFGQRLRALADNATKSTPFAMNARQVMATRPTKKDVRNAIASASCLCCCKGSAVSGAVLAAMNKDALASFASSAKQALTVKVVETVKEEVTYALYDPRRWYEGSKWVMGGAYAAIKTVGSDSADAVTTVAKDAATGVVSKTLGLCCSGDMAARVADVAGSGIVFAGVLVCCYGSVTYMNKKYTEYADLVKDIEGQQRLDDEFMRRLYRYSLQAAAKLYYEEMINNIKVMRQVFDRPSFTERTHPDPAVREAAVRDFFARRTKMFQEFEQLGSSGDLESLIEAVEQQLIDEELTLLRNIEAQLDGNGLFQLMSNDDRAYVKKNFDRLFLGNQTLRDKHQEFGAQLVLDQKLFEGKVLGALGSGLNITKKAAQIVIGGAAATVNMGVLAARSYAGDPTAMAALSSSVTGMGATLHNASNAARMVADAPPTTGGGMPLNTFRAPATVLALPPPPPLPTANYGLNSSALTVGSTRRPPSLAEQLEIQAAADRARLASSGHGGPALLGNVNRGRSNELALPGAPSGLRFRGPPTSALSGVNLLTRAQQAQMSRLASGAPLTIRGLTSGRPPLPPSRPGSGPLALGNRSTASSESKNE